MNRYVRDIVVVGGGTSGWLSAYSIFNNVPFSRITLIDKEISESVGVGEATLLNFKIFLRDYCKFNDEKIIDCLQYCDSVRKLGILYPDWGYDGNEIWHPFYFLNMMPLENHSPVLIDAWSHFQEYDIKKILPGKDDKSVRWDHGAFAEHINALKFAEYLKNDLIDDDKINYIQSGVKYIKRDDNGISSLTLENGDVITADLFIDCSGFKSILKDKRDRVDLTDRLYVDTAVVSPVEFIDKNKEIHPYTIAQVVDHGWIWKTPLQSRIGSGLIFNRSVTDIEDAKNYFCEHWDNRISPENVRVLNWKPYYDKNQWDKNVVSIGLSAGFLEPLESTGIELILQGLMRVIDTLDGSYYNEKYINTYNDGIVQQFETSIDFVNMHYSLSTKDTPFWNYVRDNYKTSETLEFFKDNLISSDKPSIARACKNHFIGGGNWTHWMVQFGYPIKEKNYLFGKYIMNNKELTKDDFYDIMIHESNWITGEEYCDCRKCNGRKILR
jgi:tryptophan halogenase